MDELTGVVLAVMSVDAEGETSDYQRFTVDLEDDTLDIRRQDGKRGDTVWMIKLADVEEALRSLKKWKRTRGV